MRESQLTSAEGRALGKELAYLRAEIDRLKNTRTTSQLPNTSIDAGYINAYDLQGQLRQRLGQQSDGTFAVTYRNGDAPPQPTGPLVSARQLAFVVGWDGEFSFGQEAPADLARVDVHSSETPGFTPDGGTCIGSLFGEGALSFPGDNDTKYVRLVAVNTSDVPSTPTAEVSVLPLPADQIAAGSIGADQMTARAVKAGSLDIPAIDDAGNLSPGSVTNAQVPVGSLSGTRISNGTVSTEQLAANSVTAPIINVPALTSTGTLSPNSVSSATVDVTTMASLLSRAGDGSIQLADGSVTARTLAAQLVLGSTIIAGNPAGARIMLTAMGIQGYRSDGTTKSLDFNTDTGDFTIIGQLKTATTTGGIDVNPGNDNPNIIRLYNLSRGKFGEIQAGTSMGGAEASIGMYSSTPNAASQRGIVIASPSGAALTFRNLSGTQQQTFISATDDHAEMYAPVVDVSSDHRMPPDSIGYRISHFHTGTDGLPIPNSILEHRTKVDDEAWLVTPTRDVGLAMGQNTLFVTNWSGGTGAGYGKVVATSYDFPSGRASKDEIEDLDFDPLSVIRAAPSKRWRYKHEKNLTEVVDDVVYDDDADDDNGEAVATRRVRSRKRRNRRVAGEAPHRIGPIAEDLPDYIVSTSPADPTQKLVSGSAMTGTLWAGMGALAERNDALTAEVAELKQQLADINARLAAS